MSNHQNMNPQEWIKLTQLEMDQYIEALEQFNTSFPLVKKRTEYLGVALSIDSGVMTLKITVTQNGEEKFNNEMDLPKEFEVQYPAIQSKALLKVVVKAAPILTSAAPKSNAGKKTAPVFLHQMQTK